MTADEYRNLLKQDFSDIVLDDMQDISKCRIDRDLPEEKRKKQ